MTLSTRKIGDYRDKDISRLERNLKTLSEGRTSLEPVSGEASGDYPEKSHIDAMNRYVGALSEQSVCLAAEIQRFSDRIASGDIDCRLDDSKHSGIYAEICRNLNKSFDSISKPVMQAVSVCKRISVNDYTEYMRDDYKGEMAAFAGGLNAALDRLVAVQALALKISKGDISELEKYRAVGKRSENDQLVPAFTAMMESIQALIDETVKLSGAAVEGDLSQRGDETKFHGEFVNIIKGVNSTLDAVVAPMNDVTDVMKKMSAGAVHIAIESKYKGQYKILVDAVNHLLSSLGQIIEEVSSVLSKMANGDLRIDSVQDFSGDYASISSSLKSILSALNSTMYDIHEASAQVAIGSNQIASSSQVLSQGAEEQSNSIEEITESVAALTKQIRQNADYSDEADKISSSVRDSAQKGNGQMKDMVQAMEDIREASSNISKIIKVIENIATQTNILALNAAVEAARAGVAGKGFAVVAGEVKALAQKSASAAKDTTELIESTIEKIKMGADIAGETAVAFQDIYSGIVSASDIIGKINTASNEQTVSVERINQAIIQVSTVVQTNTATAEESAAASEELSGQAATLKEKVDSFKLRDAKSTVSAHLNTEIMNEVMKILNEQRMAQYGAGDGRGTEKYVVGARKPAKAADKVMIALDDGEFGKY
jgi:methyl-accepting chemotaxis protein